ncbi:MAG: SDR family oxidoreductase, partial [Acidimicrobiia bacterium]
LSSGRQTTSWEKTPTRTGSAVADLDGCLVETALRRIRDDVAATVDRMKTSAAPVPLVVVGGGSILLPDEVRELAVELAPEVAVNCIAPGQIAESAQDVAEFDPTFVERAVGATPAGRRVRRPDVADIIAELCSPRWDMVTGATIPIDGGWRFHRF